MQFNMPNCHSHPCMSCIVSILVREPSVGIFSKLCANNCVLEKYKNKIKLLWTGSTDWSHIAERQVPTGISVIELK